MKPQCKLTVTVLPGLLLILTVVISCQPAETGDVIFSNVNVIDVVNGDVIETQDVVVEGNTVKEILDHGSADLQSDRIIDGTGKYLIPGLWDMHVHTWEYENLYFPLFIANGVTGIRDMHNPVPKNIIQWKDSVNQHVPFAPGIGQVTGRSHIEVPTFFNNYVIATGEDAVEAVAKRAEEGVDLFKMIIMKESLVRTIFREAERHNLEVVGHIPREMDAKMISGLGIKSIEHLMGFAIGYSTMRDSLIDVYRNTGTGGSRYFQDVLLAHEHIDSTALEETMQTLHENQTWVCPTMVVFKRLLAYYETGEMEDRVEFLPDSTVQAIYELMNGPYKQAFSDGIVRMDRYSKELMQMFRDYEVPLIAGTDTSPMRNVVPGFSLHDELYYMQDAGLSPAQVLITATINPARFMEREDEIGSVEEGKLADLVLLEADPLEDISNTKTILGVMKDGNYYDRAYLDSVLYNLENELIEQ